MDRVYIIRINDGLLTDEAYVHFDDAAYICESMLGVRPEEIDKLYEIEPMKYIRIQELSVA